MGDAGAGSLLLLLLLPLLLAHLQCTWAAGVFELQVLDFSNYRLQLASGACCGGGGATAGQGERRCEQPCRTRFTLCLKEYQATSGQAGGAGACSFGRVSSPALGTDSFTLAEPLYTLALPFTFRWTRSFTLILQAYDDYNYTEPGESGLIEEAWWSGIVEPAPGWHALRHAGAGAALAYRVRVTCQPNYYNTTCTSFCRPRDDKFGHYACSSEGDKRCLPGWRGDNCDIPVCKEGCHAAHGHCTVPGECACRPGWRGPLCAQCTPYPGCKHGSCNGSSWDCTCDTNWGGILCDQDLNYCGTHEPCRHGGTCENTAPDQYLCTCAEGFSGVDCERVDNPCAPAPCRHGVCSVVGAGAGYTCACEPGWTGALCDNDVDDCAGAPCRHGGTCRDLLAGYACACAPGWRGEDCSEDVDECALDPAPCVNAAACANTPGGYSCACLPGWTGRDCAHNVDDCTGQCLHGATCIDLVDDFHCACAPGYAGRTCSRDVDDCAGAPCRHGGECRDLLDDYRCICPVGFAGKDCELSSCLGRYCQDDRDHCLEAPCANGAPCYTAQGDYYCHCAPGWTGKNCTVRAPGAEPCGPAGAGGCRHGRCVRARCLCDAGYAGDACELALSPAPPAPPSPAPSPALLCPSGRTGPDCQLEVNQCAGAVNPCLNNATCLDSGGELSCLCGEGWTGPRCGERRGATGEGCPAGGCLHGGVCVRGQCVCSAGWGGPRCEAEAEVGCSSSPCRHGARCVASAGRWACECAAGWAGTTCEVRVPPPSPCAGCPAAAVCVPGDRSYRCQCPVPPSRASRRCLETIGGLDSGSDDLDDLSWNSEAEEWDAGGECDPAVNNGSWWWGCNVCWCGGVGAGAGAGGVAQCTRLWCGLADCLGSGGTGGSGAVCHADEVCVPAAPALCLRPPCTAPGECRRVSARRVAPPALPAPPSCWPGAAGAGVAGKGCTRAVLELARERLGRGAHVERACAALRRALAAALAPRLTPLALLCDLAADDDDALDLALWVGEEEGEEGEAGEAGEALAAAARALDELVARRRLAHHALLGAALRLRTSHVTSRPAPASPAAAAPAPPSSPAAAALWAALGALLAALLAAGATVTLRRRRARRRRAAHHDEEKSNNLQNEENLRRYANPLPPVSAAARGPPATGAETAAAAVGVGAGLPRALSLYKAHNEDARNNTPPRAPDKDFSKRALPPPDPPAPPPAPPGLALAARPPALAPPERLTVLV